MKRADKAQAVPPAPDCTAAHFHAPSEAAVRQVREAVGEILRADVGEEVKRVALGVLKQAVSSEINVSNCHFEAGRGTAVRMGGK